MFHFSSVSDESVGTKRRKASDSERPGGVVVSSDCKGTGIGRSPFIGLLTLFHFTKVPRLGKSDKSGASLCVGVQGQTI